MYIVEALRNGNRENHSYVVGVYDDLRKAATAAVAEEYWRGGKYECYINTYDTNYIESEKVSYLTTKCLKDDDALEQEIDFIVKRSKAEFITE